MSQTVISVEHLSKAYHLGQMGTGTFSRDLEVWWAKGDYIPPRIARTLAPSATIVPEAERVGVRCWAKKIR